MSNQSSKPLVWWVVPEVIGGMPMPWLHKVAIETVRECQPAAIETTEQLNFLLHLPEALQRSGDHSGGGLIA